MHVCVLCVGAGVGNGEWTGVDTEASPRHQKHLHSAPQVQFVRPVQRLQVCSGRGQVSQYLVIVYLLSEVKSTYTR